MGKHNCVIRSRPINNLSIITTQGDLCSNSNPATSINSTTPNRSHVNQPRQPSTIQTSSSKSTSTKQSDSHSFFQTLNTMESSVHFFEIFSSEISPVQNSCCRI